MPVLMYLCDNSDIVTVEKTVDFCFYEFLFGVCSLLNFMHGGLISGV